MKLGTWHLARIVDVIRQAVLGGTSANEGSWSLESAVQAAVVLGDADKVDEFARRSSHGDFHRTDTQSAAIDVDHTAVLAVVAGIIIAHHQVTDPQGRCVLIDSLCVDTRLCFVVECHQAHAGQFTIPKNIACWKNNSKIQYFDLNYNTIQIFY